MRLASGIASRIGRAFHLRRRDLRVLVGCGAAGAIAGAFGAPLGGAAAGPGVQPVAQFDPRANGHGGYAFESSGAGGTVRVIVLDYSLRALGSAQGGEAIAPNF